MLIANFGYSCDCKQFSSNEEFNFSKYVFIGKIITVNNEMFSVKVLENFKGSLVKIISFKRNDCSISPQVGENWLIYTSVNGDYVSFCGWSRNLKNPEQSIQYMGPVLFTVEAFKNEVANLKKDKAALELKLDLIKLREKKDFTSQSQNSSYKVNFEVILICILILVSIYLFIKNRQLSKKIKV